MNSQVGPIDPDALRHVKDIYTGPGDRVFELVPAEFDHYAHSVYEEIGSPDLTSENVWDVYLKMREELERLHESSILAQDDYLERWEIQESLLGDDALENAVYNLVEGQDLAGGMEHVEEDGYYYMGGVNGGLGLDSIQNKELDCMNTNSDFEFELPSDGEDRTGFVAVEFSSSDEDPQEGAAGPSSFVAAYFSDSED